MDVKTTPTCKLIYDVTATPKLIYDVTTAPKLIYDVTTARTCTCTLKHDVITAIHIYTMRLMLLIST